MAQSNKIFSDGCVFLFRLSFYKRTNKYCAFKKGLVTSRNVGSLLLLFDYVGFANKNEKMNSLVRKQTYTLTFDGRNPLHSARFLPHIRIFLNQNQTKKRRLFFLRTIFPPKDLVFRSTFWMLLKAQYR